MGQEWQHKKIHRKKFTKQPTDGRIESDCRETSIMAMLYPDIRKVEEVQGSLTWFGTSIFS